MLIVPTLNPAFLLHGAGDSSKGLARQQVVVEEDFAKAVRLTSSPPTWDERVVWETDSVGRLRWQNPSLDEIAEFVGPLMQYVLAGRFTPLTFDVETSGAHQLDCKLICIGFGYLDHDATQAAGRRVRRAINIPLLSQGGVPYWAPGHDTEVVRDYLRLLLSSPWIVKNAHNGAFDTVVMWAHGIPVHGWSEDTLAAHHALDAELPHNLGFVASRYTDGRYWKDDVKGDVGWLDMDDRTMRSYNLRDVLATVDVLDEIRPKLKAEGRLFDVYQNDVRLSQLMARATIRGVCVDLERRDSTKLDDKGRPVGLAPQLKIQMHDALEVLRQIGGPTFDPGKPAQLRWLFFEKLRLPVVKETAGGLPATDREALMLLDVAADSPEQKAGLKALSQWRQAQKFLSTFVSGLQTLRDGRFHPSWKLLTATGRFASSPNFQNLPARVKKIFRASPGHKLVGIDLSQAELRLISYYANETGLLRMYEQDINVHTVNASMLFRVRCPPEAADNINDATEDYLREATQALLGLPPGTYDAFPVVPKKKWKPTRTLAKSYQFGAAYGGRDETLYSILRSKRDPDTNDLLFPTITLAEIQALYVIWQRLNPGITSWWGKVSRAIEQAKKYTCPISGRVRRFRGGFKRNECINTGIQMGVASWMNRRTLLIQDVYDRETGGAAQIVQQVHDALTVECPDEYAQRAGEVMREILSEPFDIDPDPAMSTAIMPRKGARLPADTPMVNDFLDKT